MYKLSNSAARDLENLLEYSLTEFGLAQAESYFNTLSHCLGLLASNPEMGRSVEDIRPGYLRFVHQQHLIFYKRSKRYGILVVRILHSHMDVVRHLPP